MAGVQYKAECPGCHLTGDILAFLIGPEKEAVTHEILRFPGDMGHKVFHYLDLFRNGKNAIQTGKALQIVGELLAILEKGRLQYKRRTFRISEAVFRNAMESVFQNLASGALKPPLKDNNYFYPILAAKAEDAAAFEKRQEEERRAGRRRAAAAPARESTPAEAAAAEAARDDLFRKFGSRGVESNR
uniref:Uncharacterized protein n=1 Tax=Candidatus Kentrum sp. UNK TaxID=2126344 RepID=A0A451AQP2_9GAMM|nr:MAG: hypothetical protein BECKUNK1418G_GA0071005_100254 [Candidatus Kentron sp. UNK]VFK68325.1 MAG: hypothetical protein BECKUNK1418H_GA0071006_100154 [Candidatus Kentron sp. UNK]